MLLLVPVRHIQARLVIAYSSQSGYPMKRRVTPTEAGGRNSNAPEKAENRCAGAVCSATINALGWPRLKSQTKRRGGRLILRLLVGLVARPGPQPAIAHGLHIDIRERK